MEWISLNDKKPKVGKRVLVHPIDNMNVVISRLEDDSEYGLTWQDDDFNNFGFDTVDYWMELPKVPKK